MYRLRVVVCILSAVLTAACGDASNVCQSGAAGDGTYTLALPDGCLRGATLTVRSDGAWRSAGAEEALDVTSGPGGLRLTMSARRGPIEAFELHIPGIAADRMLQQGYQSWGFSGTVMIPSQVPRENGAGLAATAARTGEPVDEVAGVSYGAALLAGPSGRVLVAGALTAARAITAFGASRNGSTAELSILYGARYRITFSWGPSPGHGVQVTRLP